MDEQEHNEGNGSTADRFVGDEPARPTKRYDLYCFSPNNGLIVGWLKIEEPDEEAAVRRVESLGQSPPMELWCEGVLVRRWERPSGKHR